MLTQFFNQDTYLTLTMTIGKLDNKKKLILPVSKSLTLPSQRLSSVFPDRQQAGPGEVDRVLPAPERVCCLGDAALFLRALFLTSTVLVLVHDLA